MSSAGARQVPMSGRCPLAHRIRSPSSLTAQGLVPYLHRQLLQQLPHTRHTFLRARAHSGNSSVGIGATPGSAASSVGSAETNGVAAGPSFNSSAASGSGPGGVGSASSNAGPCASTITSSTRSSFRNVLKRAYLGELLFVVIGSAICGALAYWTIGTPLRRFNPYTFYIMLPQATGVHLGTPLRMKGVPMGSVLSATPMLDRVKVEVEVNEAKTIIPRNSKFELTQSGLIPVPSIDISTPEDVSADVLAKIVADRAAVERASGSDAIGNGAAPAAASSGNAGSAGRIKRSPKVRLAGPKDVTACRLQGVLVCHGDIVDGLQGGSMDELMGHMLKSLRQGENEALGGTGIVPGRGPLQGG
ncbi:hypothetical protein Vretimale_1799 [Volvox reticuliferus]|uniref:Uncharacterized protein n=1 Tax=Volvox reticuliferus TaxID=1737510 RepID=A0A8J4D598_9CHLO|nr:hypothetical protein Vretifemale_17345 [Volvox reticuliferus]GIL95895.1 hypothetical protein Vretimale_1799 [Volvox reticuliferus]